MRDIAGADRAERLKVLIVGAAGQLGQAMVAHLDGAHDVIPWTRRDVDLTRHTDVRDAIVSLAPQAIVNCASYNNVDQAEQDCFEVYPSPFNMISPFLLRRR